MTHGAVTLVFPPRGWRVLAAGLTTAARRPGSRPVLPAATLVLPDRVIDAGQVDAYARVCGFDPAAGVPAIFPHILGFPLHMALMMRRDFPFPMAGTVHIANRIDQLAPLVVGDRLTLRAGCGVLLSHPRGQAFSIDVTATRAARPVWRSTSIYLHRRGSAGVGPAVQAPPELSDNGTECWRGAVP